MAHDETAAKIETACNGFDLLCSGGGGGVEVVNYRQMYEFTYRSECSCLFGIVRVIQDLCIRSIKFLVAETFQMPYFR